MMQILKWFDIINMLEKIYLKEINLRPHLNGSLLKERNEFIALMINQGFCLRYQHMSAQHLLFAVKMLNLSDSDKSLISLERIKILGEQWRIARLKSVRRKNMSENVDTKTNSFIITTIKWLAGINRIDTRYLDDRNIFNRLNTMVHFKVKYFCAPLYDERLSYLNNLESNGMSLNTLREYAEYQLHVINILDLDFKIKVTESEVLDGLSRWCNKYQEESNKLSRKRYKIFRAVAYGWLGYANILEFPIKNNTRDKQTKRLL